MTGGDRTAIGLVGAGFASTVHGLAVEALPDRIARVVAVWSRGSGRATERARAHRARALDLPDLFALCGTVIVSTPPPTHAELTRRALEAGCAVVVETPLCASLADADVLVAAAEGGALVAHGEHLLFAPVVSVALAEMASIGAIEHLSARAHQGPPVWRDGHDRSWGGGVLLDLGVHPIALVLRAARARPVGVAARIESSDGNLDDQASVRIRFETGLVAEVDVSWRAAVPSWDLQAASATAVVRLELLPVPVLERNGEALAVDAPQDGPHPVELEQFGHLDLLREAVDGFARGLVPPGAAATDGRDVLEIVCAAYASAGTGAEVPVPFSGRRDGTAISLWRG